ncbi:raffinose synthase Sip1 [Coniochaeta sp. 2T2.1]|nr:raffinose synthase Sip1 [Coniochaeta sp. 2T2.1]
MGDGVVVINDNLEKKDNSQLPDLIHGLNPDFKWKALTSQSPGTRLWSIEVAVGAAQGEDSAIVDHPLGTPWGGFLRWFAVVRIWAPWLAPRHGKDKFELDKDAIMCSFLSPEGRHMVILAISGVSDVLTVFHNSASGEVVLHIRNDEETATSATVLVATGDNFESANAAVMYQARNLVLASKKNTGEYDKEMTALREGVRPEWYENWYDGLGYCTWNALGQRLTEEKILEAVDTLAEHKINFTNLIIDDNWQNIDYRGEGQFQYGWNGFEAEPKAFPNGLKSMITKIRSKHKNIQHIAVWHALLGYWAGIAPDGEIAKTYKTVEVVREDSVRRNLPLGGKMTVVAKEDVAKFYDDFYRFLSDCGIDGVKTDAQFMTDTWVSAKVRRELIHTYLDAWTLSALRHFSIKAISCMSQTPQNLFYAQLPRNRPALLVRNSDDFFPEIPASHPWHVWTNAHNTLFTQHLNILPDWDMFQTVHDYSGFHAAARCVSGGPIYITDVPGKHDIDLIDQMTGLTPRGKTIIFRPSVLGKSIDQYVGYDDNSLLKVGAYHGQAVTGTSIMGVFNISSRALTDIIPLERFPGVLSSMRYIVRAHSTGSVSKALQVGLPASLLTVSLGVRGWDIFTAYPLEIFHTEERGSVSVANLGLVGKMTGSAAILRNNFELERNGRMFLYTTVKALGVLGVYISILPDLTVEEDFMVTIQGKPIPPKTVSISKQDLYVVEVDIETAWNEMKLEAGWANEVEVKLYFNVEYHEE